MTDTMSAFRIAIFVAHSKNCPLSSLLRLPGNGGVPHGLRLRSVRQCSTYAAGMTARRVLAPFYVYLPCECARHGGADAPSRMKIHATRHAEHARYIDEVAVSSSPQRLSTLLKVLEAQGQSIVPPSERSGLHPLVVPLSSGSDTADGGASITGVLRWPDSTSRGMPVVQTGRGARQVALVARSIDEYIHRALAEEDVQGSTAAVREAAGAEGDAVMPRGALQESGLSSTDAYLTRKAGMYCDVVERLARNHLERGDRMSALITAEWYMRKNHFPGWARPFEFNALLYDSMGRHEEARDGARVALRFPWWTLRSSFQEIQKLAQLDGSAQEVQGMLDMASSVNKNGIPPGMAAARSPNQVAMDAADFLLNTVAAGESDWDGIRAPLADKYAEAGLSAVADFVRA